MVHPAPTCTLIITTYNWPEALKKVLESIPLQHSLPTEVIVADDGSTDETRNLIASFQANFPCPLIHSWQEDDGFRPAYSRNKAVAKASSDYIICIDGDMILTPSFIADHLAFASPNQAVAGKRMKMTASLSKKVLAGDSHPTFWSWGFLSERSILLPWRWLAKIRSKREYNSDKVMTANFAFWRKDALSVNGFNEDFIGWGPEDKEFCQRLINNGACKLKLRNAANAYHIFHNDSDMHNIPNNNAIYHAAINDGIKRCPNGIDKYL